MLLGSCAGKILYIKGSEVAGENVTLTAKGDINITAAPNTNKVESNEEKSSGGFGVSVGTTGTFSVYAKSQKSNTDTDQNISGWTQSNVTAKDTLTLTSGADANIIGSKVKGEKVNANVGGDMNIASLQDTDNYKSNSSSYGFSITSDIGGATNFSVNGNKKI